MTVFIFGTGNFSVLLLNRRSAERHHHYSLSTIHFSLKYQKGGVSLIVLLIVIVICAAIFEQYSLNHALDRIAFSSKPSRTLVEIDEEFELETVIENHKLLPLMFLRVRELLPLEIDVYGEGHVLENHRLGKELVWSLYLMPYQRFVRNVNVTLPKRGRYFIHGAYLQGGDLLGFSEQEKRFASVKEIVVPPKATDSPGLDKTLGNFMGDVSVNRFILEDPVLTLGFREYTGQEPMRNISWKQTARMGDLMVKNFDYTLDLTVTVVLNCHFDGFIVNEALEDIYSMARTVCERLENAGVPYCFITNADTSGGQGQQSFIGEGMGADHFIGILELLGRATYRAIETFEQTLDRATMRAEQGRIHIIITPELPHTVNKALIRLRSRTGSEPTMIVSDITAVEEEAV